MGHKEIKMYYTELYGMSFECTPKSML